jgi:hypothetical protein
MEFVFIGPIYTQLYPCNLSSINPTLPNSRSELHLLPEADPLTYSNYIRIFCVTKPPEDGHQ